MSTERIQAAQFLREARSGSTADASESAAWARCTAPSSRAALRMEIRLAMEHDDPDHADALIAQGLLYHGQRPDLLLLHAERLLARGRLDDARNAIECALPQRPHHAETRLVSARIALRQGRVVDAIADLEHAASGRGRHRNEAITLLVRTYLETGQPDLADSTLERITPSPPPRLVAEVLIERGDLVQAATVLEAAMNHPDSDERIMLIDILERLGDRERLVAVLAGTGPDDPGACVRAARAWLAMGEFHAARDLARYASGTALHGIATLIEAVATLAMGDEEAACDCVASASPHPSELSPDIVARICLDMLTGEDVKGPERALWAERLNEESPLRSLLESAADTFAAAPADDRSAKLALATCETLLAG